MQSPQLEHTPLSSTVPAPLRIGVYISNGGVYPESDAQWKSVCPGTWQEISFELARGTGDGPLRLIPADAPCLIEFREIIITATDSAQTLWRGDLPVTEDIATTGTLVRPPGTTKRILISTGSRPILILSAPGIKSAVRLQSSIRISTGFLELYETMTLALTDVMKELHVAQHERLIVQADVSRLQAELASAQMRLEQIRDEARRSGEGHIDSFLEEGSIEELRAFLDRTADTRRDLAVTRALVKREHELQEELTRTQLTLTGVLNSLSWKMTAPIRAITESLRGRAK